MNIIVCLGLADAKHGLVLINHLPDGKAWIAQPEGVAATQPYLTEVSHNLRELRHDGLVGSRRANLGERYIIDA